MGAATVFDPNLDGQKLAFNVEGDEILDEQTGSVWNLFGQATSGPLAGQDLISLYDLSNNPFLYNGPEDDRLPAIARVVAILISGEALAVPFSVLEREPVVHQTLAVHCPPVHEGGIAERSIGDDYRLPSHEVVNHLMPDHDLQGVCSRIAVDIGYLYRFPVFQPLASLCHRLEGGVVNRGNIVLARPPALNLPVGNGTEAEVGLPIGGGEGHAPQLLLQLLFADGFHPVAGCFTR